jgi:hypothetical protein
VAVAEQAILALERKELVVMEALVVAEHISRQVALALLDKVLLVVLV